MDAISILVEENLFIIQQKSFQHLEMIYDEEVNFSVTAMSRTK